MQSLSAIQLREILKDVLTHPIDDGVVVHDICTDTRNITADQTFAAISGENFDGHNFIDTAIDKGVQSFIIEHLPEHNHNNCIVVSDSRIALGAIASYVREQFHARGGRIIGVTGSVGKTTNKQMLASIFSLVGPTHATRGNLNNDLGVPFTWFQLPEHSDFAVIEMGANHQKEIDYLASITQPDVAMITNAGPAHLEGFGGLDGVAKGKGELFCRLQAGNTAIINADDIYADYWHTLLADDVNVLTFSLSNSSASVYATHIDAENGSFVLNTECGNVAVSLPVLGAHNIMNALGCAACAIACGIDIEIIAKGLENFSNAAGRQQISTFGDTIIIDDSYNANPLSMRAAAELLEKKSSHTIMVLGDMGELGENSSQLHTELGQNIATKADHFFCIGENMRHFAPEYDHVTHYEDLETLTQALQKNIIQQPHCTVLVKGSRSMHMERVVTALQQSLSTGG